MGRWHEMEQFTAGKGKNFEGPICFQLKPATNGQPPEWCLPLDNVSDRIGPGAFGCMPFITHDLSTGQFTPATDFRFPYPFRHGSVLPITTAERKRLQSYSPLIPTLPSRTADGGLAHATAACDLTERPAFPRCHDLNLPGSK